MELRFNNYKSWFEENRSRYEQARQAVETLVEDIIRQFGMVEDLGTLTPKECLFRINRDVRFSKDKSPYKPHFGIVIGRGGRKATGRSYYLHIEPADHSFVAAGIYDPSPEQLKSIRQAIAEKPQVLEGIIAAPEFKRYFDTIGGEKLKTPPKGYHADHPAVELLKHKQFLASHALTDDDVLRDDFAAQVVEICAALKPFEGYFNALLNPS
jgi:uncharacterized protein (TIGR02453 family)